MNRVDADRFVDRLLIDNPHLVLGVSHPRTPVAAGQEAPSRAGAATTPEREPAPQPAGAPEPAPTAEAAPATTASAQQVATATAADTEVLMSVLADLHAKGLLTSEELAAKISMVADER